MDSVCFISGDAPAFIVLSIQIALFGILVSLLSPKILDAKLRERFSMYFLFEIWFTFVCMVLILGRIIVLSKISDLPLYVCSFYDALILLLLLVQLSIYLWGFIEILPRSD